MTEIGYKLEFKDPAYFILFFRKNTVFTVNNNNSLSFPLYLWQQSIYEKYH